MRLVLRETEKAEQRSSEHLTEYPANLVIRAALIHWYL